MKKIITTTYVCMLAYICSAQIPQNGLWNHWRLDTNFTSTVSTGSNIGGIKYAVCTGPGMEDLFAEVTQPSSFVPGPTAAFKTGYEIKVMWWGRTFYCWDGPRNFEGNYRTTLQSESYHFDTVPRTISLWVKRKSATAMNIAFYTGGNGVNEAFALQMQADTVILGNRGQTAGARLNYDTLWHHFSCVYDGDSLRLYINGRQEGVALGNLTRTEPSRIFFGTGSTEVVLDDIAVHTRALSAAEIWRIYTNCPILNPIATVAGSEIRATNIAGATYQWIDCATQTPVSGATNRIFTPSANGMYAVIARVGDCADTSECVNFSSTGMDDQFALSFNLFPNPASQSLTITLDNVSHANLSVYDMYGRLVREETLTNQSNLLDISGLTNGTYFVSVSDGTYTTHKKLVIKK